MPQISMVSDLKSFDPRFNGGHWDEHALQPYQTDKIQVIFYATCHRYNCCPKFRLHNWVARKGTFQLVTWNCQRNAESLGIVVYPRVLQCVICFPLLLLIFCLIISCFYCIMCIIIDPKLPGISIILFGVVGVVGGFKALKKKACEDRFYWVLTVELTYPTCSYPHTSLYPNLRTNRSLARRRTQPLRLSLRGEQFSIMLSFFKKSAVLPRIRLGLGVT